MTTETAAALTILAPLAALALVGAWAGRQENRRPVGDRLMDEYERKAR